MTSAESNIPLTFKVVTGVVLTLLLVPIVIVVLISFTPSSGFTLPTSGLSLQWLQRFWNSTAMRDSFLYSMRVAFVAAIIATVAGTMTALWLVRKLRAGDRAAIVVISLLLVPIIMPGMAIGFAIFVVYHQLGIEASTVGLVLSQAAVALPFTVIVVAASLYRMNPELELAARSLGLGPLTTFLRVTLPLALPGITSGFLFAFLFSYGQGELSRYITPVNESTFPNALYSYLLFKLDPTPAAAGTVSIALVVVTVLVLNRLTPIGRLSTRSD